MKTSIINKIVVIFLILVMMTSFVLIICMQYAIAEYNDRYVIRKAEEMMELALGRAEEEIALRQREAAALSDVLRGGAGWKEAAAAARTAAPTGDKAVGGIYLFWAGKIGLWADGELVRLSDEEASQAADMAALLKTRGELALWDGHIICGLPPKELDRDSGAVVLFQKDFFRQYIYEESALISLTLKDNSDGAYSSAAGGPQAAAGEFGGQTQVRNGVVYGTADLRNLQAAYELDYNMVSSTGNDGSLIYFIIIVCLLLLISAFILARYLVEKIGKPLEILVEEMQDIDAAPASGRAAEIRLIDKSLLRIQEDDEIGLLIDSFNDMKLELSHSMCQLEMQNARLEAVFKNIASSVVIIDEAYGIEMMNDRGGCFFSCADEENRKGQKCYRAFAGRESPCPKCPVGRLAPGAGGEMAQNGKVFKITHTVIHYIDGRRVILVVSGDRTQEYLTNREIVELDKLAQIGKVAAAITHEVKNPLAVIKSGIYYLERMERDKVPQYIFEKEFAETISMIKESLGYAENTTQSFLSFSRSDRQTEGSRPIGLSEMLDQVMILYSHEMMKKRIRVIRQLNANELNIDMDGEMFKTILLNLIANAVEVMEKGGNITIRSALREGSWYCISVEDTGGGIREKDLENIFQLFYTTKENGTNAGVGLWIVENEVKKAGGKVSAANTTDGGASVTMFIPRRQRNEKQKENSAD